MNPMGSTNIQYSLRKKYSALTGVLIEASKAVAQIRRDQEKVPDMEGSLANWRHLSERRLCCSGTYRQTGRQGKPCLCVHRHIHFLFLMAHVVAALWTCCVGPRAQRAQLYVAPRWRRLELACGYILYVQFKCGLTSNNGVNPDGTSWIPRSGGNMRSAISSSQQTSDSRQTKWRFQRRTVCAKWHYKAKKIQSDSSVLWVRSFRWNGRKRYGTNTHGSTTTMRACKTGQSFPTLIQLCSAVINSR